ncbi:MAG: NAD(P)H-hydrate dehydratase, partial [Lentisphaeria bacterium]|nr:NAD(P)H-hydrate dehydratase [Lentisphaeria bacterium]
FHGELKGDHGKWICLANASEHHIVALDIPSVREADTGKRGAHAVEADLTLTMANPKKGMLSPEGALLCGRIQVLDIGIPETFADEIADFQECTVLSDVKKCFPKEKADIHKYERGHVLVLGGSCLYSGAPLLAGEAAARTGAGLVSVVVPEGTLLEGRMIPKALMIRKTGGKGFFSSSCWEEIGSLAEKAGVIVVGPGMGTNGESVPFLRDVLRTEKRVIADADALNLLAENPELFQERTCKELVLTPHEGEMRRLEKTLSLDSALPREERTKRLAAKVHAFVVCKGVRTIVCSPEGRKAVNLSGSPALATAGSGDVLAGICGALLLKKDQELFTALRAAVFLHGLAGELADPSGSRGVLADDLLWYIAPAMRKISPRA